MSYGSEAERRPRTHGRAEELALLDRALDDAAAGRFGAVLLEGEPGIGKSHLLAAVREHADVRGFAVLVGRCDEFAQRWPLHGIADLVRSLGARDGDPTARTAAAILDVIGGGLAARAGPIVDPQPEALARRVTELLLDLVESEAVHRPVALAFDDLQWADPSTLLVLGALLDRLRHQPAVVVASSRSGERPVGLERIVDRTDSGDATLVRLGGLGAASVAELTEDLLGAAPTQRLQDYLETAAGNPFFVVELIGALSQDGAIVCDEGGADLMTPSLPPSLRLVVLRRLAALPEPTLDALRFAAVLGRTFSLERLAGALDVEASALVPTLAPAVRRGLVGEAGADLRFSHDLVRAAIYDDIPLAFRRVMHAQAGRALWDSGAPLVEVFEHLSAGSTAVDDETMRRLEQAATDAVVRSPQLAVRVLDHTLGIAADRYDGRQLLEVRLVEALVASGELARAEALARELLSQRLTRSHTWLVGSALGRALFYRGRFAEAADLLHDAAEGADDPIEGARSRALGALSATFADHPEAPGRVERAVATAEQVGDALAATYCYTARAEQARMRGHLRAGAEAARRAGEVAARVWRDPTMPPAPVPAGHLIAAGELAEAEGILHSGHWAQTATSSGLQPIRHVFLALLHLNRGDYDRAASEAETAVVLAHELASSWATGPALAVSCRVAVHRGDLEVATRTARALEELGDGGALVATALVLDLRRDAAGLRRHLDDARSLASGDVATLISQPSDVGILVRLHQVAGLEDAAHALADEADHVAARADVPWCHAQAAYARGLVDDDSALLDAAASQFHAAGMVPRAAAALEAAGLALARRGDRPRAVAALTRARQHYEQIGATQDLRRTRRLLRDLGVQTLEGHEHRARAETSTLTAAEERVATLIQQGLTYREIGEALYISKRTVETHAAHIFQKLGVPGRRALERQAPRRLASGEG